MKKILSPLLGTTVLLLAVSPATALTIEVTRYGEVRYFDEVLGKNTDTPAAANRPSKVVPARAAKPISVEPIENKLRVESETEVEDDSEVQEARRVSLKFPSAEASSKKMAREETLVDMPEDQEAYMEQLRLERQERLQEQTELRSRLEENGNQGLSLRSRDVEAKLKPGASFTLDPTTNEVLLTTPSGNEHVLNHLPDQAIERMFSAGVLRENPEATESGIDLTVNEGGGIIYRTVAQKAKRFLGIIPVEVETEVELDDTTGEVTEEEVAPENLLQSIVQALSF